MRSVERIELILTIKVKRKKTGLFSLCLAFRLEFHQYLRSPVPFIFSAKNRKDPN